MNNKTFFRDHFSYKKIDEINKMSKSEIYIDMLLATAHYIRLIQCTDEQIKINDESCYYESELVHGLGKFVLQDEVTEQDFYFLDSIALHYIKNCNNKISTNYDMNSIRIKRLIALLSEESREALSWSWPE